MKIMIFNWLLVLMSFTVIIYQNNNHLERNYYLIGIEIIIINYFVVLWKNVFLWENNGIWKNLIRISSTRSE